MTGGAGGSRLAGAAGVGLGAGGSCGQESGTGAAGRKGGIRRTRCELRQPGKPRAPSLSGAGNAESVNIYPRSPLAAREAQGDRARRDRCL